MYYVYEYTNPLNNDVFYVGKGRNDRYKSHLTNSHNKQLNFYLSVLKDQGLEPIIEKVYFNEDEDKVLEYEESLINKYELFSNGGSLCNLLKKTSSNTRIRLTEEAIKLIGTMKDKDVAKITGFNWSTIRDHRRNLGIKSFKERNIGKKALGDHFRNDGNIYTIYHCNGEVLTGTRYELESLTGLKDREIVGVLRCEKVGRKHCKGWSTKPNVTQLTTVYTIKSVTHPVTGETYENVTYKELAELIGEPSKNVRNLFTGSCNSLKGWRISTFTEDK